MTAVLIVDDSLTVRMDLTEALAGAGFTPIGCASLAEARAALATRPIALAILDVRLPDGDGVELLHELRERPATAQLPVLLLSTEAEVRDRVRGLTRGANDYIGKPYDRGFVLGRVAQLTGTATGTGSDLVLVVDDSPTFRGVLESALAGAGYATAVAADGIEGLRLAASLRPAAMIVDGYMPGMDGTAVIRRLRLDPLLRETPCLMLTGSGGERAELAALDAGADAFMRKTEEVELVLARLATMLRGASRAERGPATPATAKRILAVDDSPTFLHSVGDHLREEGYDVVLASSGEEAIELLAVQQVECILLDRMMPGLSGQETCSRIKQAPVIGDIPLIMLTAVESGDAVIEGLAAGADDYIAKSAGFEVIGARIRAQIRRRQIEDEHRRVREQLLRSERHAAEADAARALAEARAAMAEQLERSNAELDAANRELEAFSYSVSHDLRAPLRSIGGFARALEEDLGPDLAPEHADYLRRIQASTARMGELIDSLLELSRLGQSPIERCWINVPALVASLIAELPREGRVIDVVVEPKLTVEADPLLARILFMNLLSNAWKFTSRVPEARIELGQSGERTYFVRDNGAGFDMAKAERLFMPFRRLHTNTEFAGTGIGLATVRRIIERHGGRIWAESTVGKGATFFFTLP